MIIVFQFIVQHAVYCTYSTFFTEKIKPQETVPLMKSVSMQEAVWTVPLMKSVLLQEAVWTVPLLKSVLMQEEVWTVPLMKRILMQEAV